MTKVLLALCVLLHCGGTQGKRVLHDLYELSNTCDPLYVNVDNYDEVDIKSMRQRSARHSASASASCMAYFKTSQPGQGLCIRMQGVLITSEHVRLEFHTGPYGPEKIIRKDSPWRGDWCFPDRLVAVKVMTSAFEEHVDRAAIYSFAVRNVSLDDISRHYYMDSFVECGLTHKLESGQTVGLDAERDPHVTPDLFETCKLTFESTSEDEYEQVCVKLQVTSADDVTRDVLGNKESDVKPKMEAEKNLQLEGLNARFYSTNQALDGEVVCSENKRLEVMLTRNTSVPFTFRATVSSQWHPNWEKEESDASELRGLRIVKGVTYFIATIDSLVAVLAACLAAILKRPTGPWRRWAEHFNAQAAAHAPQAFPPQDPASYGSMHTCKDGNYPELPLEGATPINEVLVEAHTY